MTRFSILKTPWFLDFVTTNTGGIFEEFIIPEADLVSSMWNKYVYRVYSSAEGDSNNHTCKAMCAFDSDNIGTRDGIEIMWSTKIVLNTLFLILVKIVKKGHFTL